MCIVCGPGGARFLQTVAQRYGALAAARPRFVAEEVEPATAPQLDPDDREALAGPADVILHGGRIWTMRRNGESVGALSIRDGRIQALGAADEVLALRGRLTRVIDLDGRVVTPGFINAHWRPPLSLLADWLNGDDAAAPEALRAAANADAGEWLVVQSAEPRADLVDQISATASRPALLIDRSGRILFGNRAADPYIEAPHAHVCTLLPSFATRLAVSRDPLRRRLRRTFAALARGGFTCVKFCGLGGLTGEDDIALVREIVASGRQLRVRGALDMRLWNEGRAAGEGDDMFRIDELAGWLGPDMASDGDLARRAAALRKRGWRLAWSVEGDVLADAVDPDADALEVRAEGAERLAAQFASRSPCVSLTLSDPPQSNAAAALSALEKAGARVVLSLDRVAGVGSFQDILGFAPGRLDLATQAPARHCGAGAILGALDAGRYADLAFFDADPAVSAARCLSTWIEGRETAAGPAGAFL